MKFEVVRPSENDSPLLYSLAEFREVIFSALEIVGASAIVEIGAEEGLFDRQLLGWVRQRGGRLTSIDPAPSDAVRAMADADDAMALLVTTSIEALADLPAADAYLIDGDHNFHTVSNELALIAAALEAAGRPGLVVAQDCSWPAGRRDQYYAPDSIPADAAQPWSYGGVTPWDAGVVGGGFRGGGAFAFARREGGDANGVATAIEGFLDANPGWRCRWLPCIFGLAFIYPADAPWAGPLDAALAPFDDHPLLRRLEANRLLLYLRLIDAQDRLAEERRTHADEVTRLRAVVEDQRSTIEALEAVAGVSWDLSAVDRTPRGAAR